MAIFTIHLDGLRELYRQFLRLPDGAIIEVYDISTGIHLLNYLTTIVDQTNQYFSRTFTRRQGCFYASSG